MENSIQDVVHHIKSLIELKFGAIGIYNSTKEVHVDNANFLNFFNNYKATDRNSDEYPIELSEVVDGIRFYAIFQIGDFHASSK